MSGKVLPCAKGRLACIAFGLCIAISGSVFGQTISITEPVADEVTRFTFGGVVPPTLIIPVEAETTAPVVGAHFGLNGTNPGSGNDWFDGDDGSPGSLAQGTNDTFVASLDLAQANLTPNGITSVTLHAFGLSTSASGYGGSNTSVIDFIAHDFKNILVNIQDASNTDFDGNGIPNSERISSLTSFSGSPVDSQFRPDPINFPDYWIERRVVSIKDFGLPVGLTFFSKQFVIDFQLYDITIVMPNFAWFKANRAFVDDDNDGVNEIFESLNIVLVIRAEERPEMLMDNSPNRPLSDPLFSDEFTYDGLGEPTLFGITDPVTDFENQFDPSITTPNIFFNISVMVETTFANWIDLPLSASAPMVVSLSSTGLEDRKDVHLYRTPATTIQSTTIENNVFLMGDGKPWVELNIGDLSSNGATTSVTFSELTRGALFAISTESTDVPVDDEGGGGGGVCFIATAAYGTPMAHEVDVLREFRDRYLLNSAIGSVFVDGYYRLSPHAADTISKSEALRVAARIVLTPVIWMTQIFLTVPELVTSVFIATIGLYFLRRRQRLS